jgi:type III pantothenate kinase
VTRPPRIATADLGNSRLKVLVWDGERVAHRSSAPTNDLTELGQAEPDRTVGAVVVASVVPHRTDEAARLLEARFPSAAVRVVTTADATPLEVAYRTPLTLGTDRIAAALGGVLRFPDAPVVVVIDAGTAVTFEVVVGRRYLGGTIAPGPDLQMRALASGTAQLPRVAFHDAPPTIGRETAEALAAGVWWGFVGGVEGTLARIRRELGAPPRVLLTGGWAERLSAHIGHDALAPDLVHEGLRALALG